MTNYVLVNDVSEVVMRSAGAPIGGDFAPLVLHETEEWPSIGAVRSDDGTFSARRAPLGALKESKAAAIGAERTRRIDGGLTFEGRRYQTRPDDRENVAGAAQLAIMAIMGGAQAGDLRWHGGDADFVWIAADNSLVPMDVQTVIAFAKAAAAMKSACIFHALALKEAIDEAPDEASLDAIDIAAGWPA